MRKPNQKILLEKEFEILEQYDYFDDEEISAQKDIYAKSIGYYLITFSRLETSLDQILADQINDRAHEPGYRIIKYFTFRNKISLLEDHLKRKVSFFEDEKVKSRSKNDLKNIISKLIEINQFRNKIAHANWMTLNKKGFVRVQVKEDEDGGISFENVKMTPGIIRKFIRQADSLSNRIFSYADKVENDLNKEMFKRQKAFKNSKER